MRLSVLFDKSKITTGLVNIRWNMAVTLNNFWCSDFGCICTFTVFMAVISLTTFETPLMPTFFILCLCKILDESRLCLLWFQLFGFEITAIEVSMQYSVMCEKSLDLGVEYYGRYHSPGVWLIAFRTIEERNLLVLSFREELRVL